MLNIVFSIYLDVALLLPVDANGGGVMGTWGDFLPLSVIRVVMTTMTMLLLMVMALIAMIMMMTVIVIVT